MKIHNDQRYVAGYLIFVFTVFFSSNCFSMFCPANFNEIEIGDAIEQVIKVCGPPDSQSEYQQTITEKDSYNQSQEYYDYQSGASYIQSNNNRLKSKKEKVIIFTKLTYTASQPATLIFEDGRLKERVLNGSPSLRFHQ